MNQISQRVWLLFVLLVLGSSVQTFAQTASTTQGCFPLSVDFSAPGGSSSYFWDFNDGATSSLENPSHTFISDGTFTVAFSESPGGAVIGTITINVYQAPIPTFTSNVTAGCAPLLVTFDDATTLPPGVTVSSYSWVFGDGGSDTGPSASHVFSTPGSFSVSLGLTTNLPSCDVTELVPDVIQTSEAPAVSFTTTPNPPIFCDPPATVGFTNTSSSPNPLTYAWDFDNGQTSTATNPGSQTFNVEGNYTVTLIATDDNECSQSSQLIVGIGQPVASFNVADTVCLNVQAQMNNLSPAGNYTWDFGPFAVPQNSSLVNPLTTFTQSGFHDITLTINGDCPDDTTITVYVQEVSAEFTANPTYSCSSPMLVNFTPLESGLNYMWDFDGIGTSTDQNPTFTYEVMDTTTYSINGAYENVNYFETTLVVTSAAGCSAEYTLTDTIHEPNALSFPNVVEGCAPLEVTFANASTSIEEIVEWTYVFGDGGTISFSDGDDQTNVYATPGEYEFYSIITNAVGCLDTSFVQVIEVGEMLSPNFSVTPTEVCPGETVAFANLTADPDENIDAWHYDTEGSLMFHCFQESDAEWAFDNLTGPQDVTLTVEYNGCYSSTTQAGAVNVLGPISHASYVCDCDNPYDIQFVNNSGDYTDVVWHFGDGSTSSDVAPFHTYAETGDYEVVLQTSNSSSGCADSFDTVMVFIRDLSASLILPDSVCQGVPFIFDATAAADVDAHCYRGYNFSFSDPDVRPITTADPTVVEGMPNVGNLDVTLTVTDVNGCTASTTTATMVYGIQADFAIEPLTTGPEICFPSQVQFSDSSVADLSIVDWHWDFGDGELGVGSDVTHTFTSEDAITGNPNVIQVELTVTDTLGCVSDITQLINFYTPVSQVTVSDNSLCAGDSTSFTATDFTDMGSNLSYTWDYGTGDLSNEQNPGYVFNQGGDYQVNLVFVENSTGCMDSTQVAVQVADYPLVGWMSAVDTVPVICPNENVVFNDTTILNGGTTPTYSWDFGNGSTSSFQSPGTFFSDNGTYTVELIVEIPAPFACADTAYQEYEVYGPMGGFTTDIGDEAICRLDEVLFTINTDTEVDTFYWDFGDGVLGPGVSPISHQYDFVPPSGQTFAAMVMSNADGSCPVVEEVPINIHEVRADFDRNFNDVDTAICFQAYPLTNVSLNSDVYYWDFGDGNTSTAADPGLYPYAEPGTYGVTLGVANSVWGCTDTMYKEIVLHPLPLLAATGDLICEGELGEIDVVNPHPIWDYQWTTASGFGITDNTSPSTTSQPDISSEYEVLVTDTNSCTAMEMVSIIVVNPPVADDYETIVPIGDIVTLPLFNDTSVYIYSWTPDDIGTNCLECDPPWVQAFYDQTYDLTITDVSGCFELDVQYIVNVHPETFVSLPTTFTPNGDGVNDIIYVEGWGVKDLIEFKVYNRWGQIVFESSEMTHGWDGKYNGVLQNNDVYVYKVSALTWRDEVKTLEGHINLMR